MTFELAPRSKQTTYDIAFLYCLTLSYAGHKDWRMPTIMEYSSSSDFRLCWYQDDEYAGKKLWHTVPVRDTI